MAGSISLSLSQQFDELGEPLNGGLLYFFAAGTTTPQSAYQDVALTLPYPNPIVLDSAGRVPAFYLADGQIKIRLASAAGVTQVAADNLLVIGASSGSGSPPSVDATTISSTGDLKVRYGTGVHTGWVRSNGRTIGSASSGASERANADCQDLFEYLWTEDANLSVSTGRGASANADWTANKTIALPDWRGRTLAGLDDMGNTAAGTLTTSTNGFGLGGGVPTTLGQGGGYESRTLTLAQIPTGITSPYTTTVPGGKSLALYLSPAASSTTSTGSLNTVYDQGGVSNITFTTTLSGTATSDNTGGGAHAILSPTRLATIYMKL
jgi:hypothetical protein